LPSGRPYLDGLTLAVASRTVARHSSVEARATRMARNEFRRDAAGLDRRRLQQVVLFMEEQLAEDLPLAQIAAVAGLSASRLAGGFINTSASAASSVPRIC